LIQSKVIQPSFKAVLACVAVALAAGGCVAHRAAPVVERAPAAKPTAAAKTAVAALPVMRSADTRPEFYTVKKGDTLYSIALDHGLDYRELAQLNGITDPGVIGAGHQLRLKPPQATVTTAPLVTTPGVEVQPLTGASLPPSTADSVKSQPQALRLPYSDQAYAQVAGISPAPAQTAKVDPRVPPAREEGGDNLDWGWPASGKVIGAFDDGSKLKGISIAGRVGQPVLASAAGRVIFSGTGIRGFGKLIVIKHNNTFLSVYGHNSELLVKEGQNVAKGQRIAEMGSTDADQVKLHFEIRRFGRPVDPIKLLPPA
jgi:lipoprotein NlpD